VRRLQARIEKGREDRNRRIEMLKTLALHLAWLRAGAAEAPADVPSLSEHVQRLCAGDRRPSASCSVQTRYSLIRGCSPGAIRGSLESLKPRLPKGGTPDEHPQ
jgi:hypothetical protein